MIAIGVASFLSSHAIGEVTAIVVNPSEPLVVGYYYTYGIQHNKPSAGAYSWRYRCLESGGAGWTSVPNQGSPAYGFLEDRVGSVEVEGGAKEIVGNPPPYPPPSEWSYLTRQFTILGPTTDTLRDSTPLFSSGYPYMAIPVYFDVYAGNIKVGADIDGVVQERIRKPHEDPPFDSGWAGPEAGFFEWKGHGILDYKFVSIYLPAFSTADVDEVFDEIYQQNRFVIKDCAGNLEEFYFPERRFQKIKVSSTQWKLIEVSP